MCVSWANPLPSLPSSLGVNTSKRSSSTSTTCSSRRSSPSPPTGSRCVLLDIIIYACKCIYVCVCLSRSGV